MTTVRTATAFDALAATYDGAFSGRRLGRWLREAVRRHLAEAFPAGSRVLELGCGTGEDAVWLAGRGVRVHATDASAAMLDVAREKVERSGVGGVVTLENVSLGGLARGDGLNGTGPYDGAFSNFGALNCIADRTRVAEALAGAVRPGGSVVLVVMGPLCPWEWVWYGLRGRPRTAWRRVRGMARARVGSFDVPVWYPSPGRLKQEFGPYFRPVYQAGIGVVLPPSYGAGLVDRHPRLFSVLEAVDRRIAHRFPGTWFNDHYVVVFERTSREVPHA